MTGALARILPLEQNRFMRRTIRRLVAALGFGALVFIWNSEAKIWRGDTDYLYLMFFPLMLVPVTAVIGRYLLRKRRQPDDIAWITLFVHYSVMLVMGISIIAAFKIARVHPLYEIPYPREASFALVKITGAIVATTVLNLALRGLGAPFAIALSRRLATDFLYRYTRNPMVVSLIAFFLAAGLWLQSTLFLLWALFVLIPAELSVVKIYEERELELRFGEQYLTYKRATPMLLGFRRQASASAATSRQ